MDNFPERIQNLLGEDANLKLERAHIKTQSAIACYHSVNQSYAELVRMQVAAIQEYTRNKTLENEKGMMNLAFEVAEHGSDGVAAAKLALLNAKEEVRLWGEEMVKIEEVTWALGMDKDGRKIEPLLKAPDEGLRKPVPTKIPEPEYLDRVLGWIEKKPEPMMVKNLGVGVDEWRKKSVPTTFESLGMEKEADEVKKSKTRKTRKKQKQKNYNTELVTFESLQMDKDEKRENPISTTFKGLTAEADGKKESETIMFESLGVAKDERKKKPVPTTFEDLEVVGIDLDGGKKKQVPTTLDDLMAQLDKMKRTSSGVEFDRGRKK